MGLEQELYVISILAQTQIDIQLVVDSMYQPTVNFMSYNSTGMDQVKSSWFNDLLKVTKIDYCTVQEHLKKNNDTFLK